MAKVSKVWRAAPSTDDLSAAQSYLSLLCSPPASKSVVQALSRARTFRATAKDLLRASDLPLLPRHESHVKEDLKRIKKGKPLSPVLLVRGAPSEGTPLVIADGYHRVCAVCHFDEDASIACRIAPVTGES
jgi:hypothetical protein